MPTFNIYLKQKHNMSCIYYTYFLNYSIYQCCSILKNMLFFRIGYSDYCIFFSSSDPSPLIVPELRFSGNISTCSQLYRKFCNYYDMNYVKTANKIIQGLLDHSVPYKKQRWIALLTLTAYVLYRILVYDFLAIMFFWGLYVLYLLVQFFTPSGLPDPDQDVFEAPPPLFEQSQQFSLNSPQSYQVPEDRPLLRSITEFTLWKNIMLTLIASWFFTLSYIFQIPVYWPFLFIYFVWLIGLAIHKHLRHMRKYGYSPKDFSANKNKKVSNEIYL